jgi:hypothetical protein
MAPVEAVWARSTGAVRIERKAKEKTTAKTHAQRTTEVLLVMHPSHVKVGSSALEISTQPCFALEVSRYDGETPYEPPITCTRSYSIRNLRVNQKLRIFRWVRAISNDTWAAGFSGVAFLSGSTS